MMIPYLNDLTYFYFNIYLIITIISSSITISFWLNKSTFTVYLITASYQVMFNQKLKKIYSKKVISIKLCSNMQKE